MQDGSFYYMLDPQVWRFFDPFIPVSERNEYQLSNADFQTVTSGLNVYNNPDGDILWIEYSDIQCGYCQRLHNDETPEQLFEIFGNKLSYAYTYFPIFNEVAPQAFECILEQTDMETWYSAIKKSYQNSFREVDQFASLVPTLDRTKFDTCVQEGKYTQKIQTQANNGGFTRDGSGIFRVSGTPGNILINTKTREFRFLSGAYPLADFEATITELLAVKQ